MAAVATVSRTEPVPEEPETSSLPISPMGRRRPTYRSLSSLTPRYRCCSPRYEEQPHFLDACSLCKKPLGGNRDIFMYRGNTPFCSEECRQEQIDMDETMERKWSNLAVNALSRTEKSTEEVVHVRAAETVVAG